MNHRIHPMFTLALFLLSGCDGVDDADRIDADDEYADDEDIEDRELNGPPSPADYQMFEWLKGMPALNLGPTTQRSCFLAGFNGSLAGQGDGAVTARGISSWSLTGKGATWGARAACVASGFAFAEQTLHTVENTGIKDIGAFAGRACFLESVEGPVNGDLSGPGMRGAMLRADPSGTRWHFETYGTGVKATARCVGLSWLSLSAEKFWKTGQAPLAVGTVSNPCFATRVFGNYSKPDDRVGIFLQNISGVLQQYLGGLAVSGQAQIGVRCLSPTG